jgi:hypothetical protein
MYAKDMICVCPEHKATYTFFFTSTLPEFQSRVIIALDFSLPNMTGLLEGNIYRKIQGFPQIFLEDFP